MSDKGGQVASLAEVLGRAPVYEPERVVVDVSDILGEDVCFVLEEPSPAGLWRALEEGKWLRKRNPDWTEEFARTVAYVARAHREPPVAATDNVLLLYEQIAKTQPKLWNRLFEAATTEFATAGNIEEAVSARQGE